jgi:hypothetical protein
MKDGPRGLYESRARPAGKEAAMTTRREPDPTDVVLSVPVETVCRIIGTARRFDLKGGSTDPGARALDDDDVAAVFEDRASDPVENELRSVISDLADDQQVDLVALVWLGRDDGTSEDWEETRRTAAVQHTDRTADYLCGTPLLADHLRAGLEAIGRDCTDVEADQL